MCSFCKVNSVRVDLSLYLRHLSPLIRVYGGGLLQDKWQGKTEVLEKKLLKNNLSTMNSTLTTWEFNLVLLYQCCSAVMQIKCFIQAFCLVVVS
jgi:hypothetical protein